MATRCNAHKQAFHDLGSRAVVGRFDGEEITSDAGGLLLREADRGIGLSDECQTKVTRPPLARSCKFLQAQKP